MEQMVLPEEWLQSGAVISVASGDVVSYYQQLWRVIYPDDDDATQSAFAQRMAGGAAPYLDLAGAVTFADVTTCSLTDAFSQALAALIADAPCTEGEVGQCTWQIGFLDAEFGCLPAGAALVKRTSKVAVVLYAPGFLRFEEAAMEMPQDSPSGADDLPPPRYGVATLAVANARMATAPRTDASSVFSALSTISGALSWVPHAGPVFSLAQGLFDLIGLIIGESKPSEYELMLNAMQSIFRDELTDSAMRTQLANMDGFIESYRSHYVALKYSNNREQYIVNHFLPTLDFQLSNVSGTIHSVVQQFYRIWSDTFADNWKIGPRRLQFLRGMALAVGCKLMAHHTRVMLHAELVKTAQNNGRAIADPQNAMLDALSNFGYAMLDAQPSAGTVLNMIEEYRSRRADSGSIYYAYNSRFFDFVFYARDLLNDDTQVARATYDNTRKGREWFNNWAHPRYHREKLNEAMAVLAPLRNDLIKMIDGYHALNRATRNLALARLDGGVLWPNGRAFFFSGRRYTAFDSGRNGVAAPPYPRSIAGPWREFPPSFNEGVDAVLKTEDGSLYIFKGDEYLRYDMGQDRVMTEYGYPKKTAPMWPGWPADFFPLDAAVSIGKKVFFFKGDSYFRFDLELNRVSDGYPKKIRNHWAGWPASFMNIDAAINWHGNLLYFFKGDKYIRFNTDTDLVEGGPRLITDGWPGLMWW